MGGTLHQAFPNSPGVRRPGALLDGHTGGPCCQRPRPPLQRHRQHGVRAPVPPHLVRRHLRRVPAVHHEPHRHLRRSCTDDCPAKRCRHGAVGLLRCRLPWWRHPAQRSSIRIRVCSAFLKARYAIGTRNHLQHSSMWGSLRTGTYPIVCPPHSANQKGCQVCTPLNSKHNLTQTNTCLQVRTRTCTPRIASPPAEDNHWVRLRHRRHGVCAAVLRGGNQRQRHRVPTDDCDHHGTAVHTEHTVQGNPVMYGPLLWSRNGHT